MGKFLTSVTIVLDAITLQDEIEADTSEEAVEIMEKKIEQGSYDTSISQHAESVGYEVVNWEATKIKETL